MKTGKKPILWSLIALTVTCFMFVPGLNLIALLLMLVPYTVLYTLLDRNSWIVHSVIVLAVGSIIIGPVPFLSISILAMIPSLYLGKYYKQGMPSIKVVPRITALVLLVMMIGLFMLETIFDISFITDMSKFITLTFNDMLAQGLVAMNWTTEMTDQFVSIMVRMIPLVFFVMALIIVSCSHTIARRVVLADGLQVTPYPKAKDWRLPKSLVWLYLITYIIEMMLDPTEGSFMTIAILNLVPALSILFTIQAVGFFFFIADHFRWPKIIPFLIAIPVLLFPLSSVLGLLDVAFPLRKKISKQQ